MQHISRLKVYAQKQGRIAFWWPVHSEDEKNYVESAFHSIAYYTRLPNLIDKLQINYKCLFLSDLKPNMKYWIGLQRSGSDWKLLDNSIATYRNWANSVTPTTGCVIANAANTARGTWSTIACTQRYAGNQGAICKLTIQDTTGTVISITSATEYKSLFTL